MFAIYSQKGIHSSNVGVNHLVVLLVVRLLNPPLLYTPFRNIRTPTFIANILFIQHINCDKFITDADYTTHK